MIALIWRLKAYAVDSECKIDVLRVKVSSNIADRSAWHLQVDDGLDAVAAELADKIVTLK